jgi:hypothetical protein
MDFVKATVICGILSFICYSVPVVGQALVIGTLGLLWLGYAYKTVARIWQK